MASGTAPRRNRHSTVGPYKLVKKIGRGSFAEVFQAIHQETRETVAVKAIKRRSLTRKTQENLRLEIAILSRLEHQNIVRLLSHHESDSHVYLLLEFCAGGDLSSYIRSNNRGKEASAINGLPESTVRYFGLQLASGLLFLKSRNVMHRDLKPHNLLLSERSDNARLKLADFGFARHLGEEQLAETTCGSPLYMAPEVLLRQRYSDKCDLWSAGAIIFEMASGRPPFGGSDVVRFSRSLKTFDRPALTAGLTRIPTRAIRMAYLRRRS